MLHANKCCYSLLTILINATNDKLDNNNQQHKSVQWKDLPTQCNSSKGAKSMVTKELYKPVTKILTKSPNDRRTSSKGGTKKTKSPTVLVTPSSEKVLISLRK